MEEILPHDGKEGRKEGRKEGSVQIGTGVSKQKRELNHHRDYLSLKRSR
jgi:hypothetical protein